MMHDTSKSTPSFAMPTTVGFKASTRRWHSVLALRTLIVEVVGSILELEAHCACVSLLSLCLEGSAAITV